MTRPPRIQRAGLWRTMRHLSLDTANAQMPVNANPERRSPADCRACRALVGGLLEDVVATRAGFVRLREAFRPRRRIPVALDEVLGRLVGAAIDRSGGCAGGQEGNHCEAGQKPHQRVPELLMSYGVSTRFSQPGKSPSNLTVGPHEPRLALAMDRGGF